MILNEDDTTQENKCTMSKSELRKTHKPIMEKRRRARINTCLNEIKSLILEAMNKDPERHTKLEKADILEMAVKHLQNVQNQQFALAIAKNPSVLRKFKNGFHDCIQEVDKYVAAIDGVDYKLKERMMSYLRQCTQRMDQIKSDRQSSSFNSTHPPAGFINVKQTYNDPFVTSNDPNNNAGVKINNSINISANNIANDKPTLLLSGSTNAFPINKIMVLKNRPSAFVAVFPTGDKYVQQDLAYDSNKNFNDSINILKLNSSVLGLPITDLTHSSMCESTSRCPETDVSKNVLIPPFYSNSENKILLDKTISEPLTLITNNFERYRQAKGKEDSTYLSENRVQMEDRRKGMSETNYPLLLTFAKDGVNCDNQATTNNVKNEAVASPHNIADNDVSQNNRQRTENDMWRPW